MDKKTKLKLSLRGDPALAARASVHRTELLDGLGWLVPAPFRPGSVDFSPQSRGGDPE